MKTTVFTNEEISLLDRLETAAFESIIFSHCSIEKAHRANVEKSDAEEELKQIAMQALQNGDNSRIKALRAEMDARIDYGTANARKIEHEAGDYITGKLTYQPLGNNSTTAEEEPAKADEIIACIDDYIVDVDAAAEVEIEISAIKKNIYPEDTEILIQQIQDKIEINQYCVAQCEKDIQRIQNDIKATVEKEVSRIADYMSKIILLTVKKDSLSSQITRYKILKNLFDTQRNIRGCIKNGEFDSAENFANCAKILLSVLAA